jgi:hypothetical protein
LLTSLKPNHSRLFKVNRQQIDDDDDPPLLDDNHVNVDVDIIIRPESNSRSINAPMTSGNNILNSNLSGSFRDESEISNQTSARIPSARRAHRSAPNILQPSTSTEAASPPQQIGVAALPNIQFLSRERNGFI